MNKLEFAIAIHGGAGVEPDKLSDDEKRQYHDSLAKALEVGRKILAGGGSSLDAVEQTLRVLEDDPLFNAGRGAVFNSAGHARARCLDHGRCDAPGWRGGGSYDGQESDFTGPARDDRNAPRALARRRGRELCGRDARQTADRARAEQLFQHRRAPQTVARGRRAQKKKRQAKANKGTVGCVALDKQGNLAAGTSTGGLTNKRWGRVGDSPILGAGTYANNATCAVSCTGTGEYFIRDSIAFHVSALMRYKDLPLDKAVHYVIDDVLEPDTGGLIAVDSKGNISMQFNTAGMARAATDSGGKVEIKLGK